MLFSNFIDGRDDGIENGCPLFDTDVNAIKLLRSVRLLYRIGIKYVNKIGKMTGKSRMDFNKNKCKILH